MDHQERWYSDNIELEGRVVVDVGANVGRLSRFFWERAGERGRVVSIEPQPENVARLEQKIAEAAAKNWTVEACAVSSSEGTLRMRAFDVAYGKNSVVLPSGREGSDDVREIPCRVLERMVPDAQVVKLDIEGHEYEILPTAVPALARAEVWALELHMVAGHELQDSLALLLRHGFALYVAGRKKDDPSGAWLSVPNSGKLSWAQIPGTPSQIDGVPGLFKMLHVLAKR